MSGSQKSMTLRKICVDGCVGWVFSIYMLNQITKNWPTFKLVIVENNDSQKNVPLSNY